MTDDDVAEIAFELIATLATDAEQLHLSALFAQFLHLAARCAHDRGVETAAEAAVGGHHHDQMHLLAAIAGQQRRRTFAPRHAGCQRAQHALHALGIGTRRFGRLLRAAAWPRPPSSWPR